MKEYELFLFAQYEKKQEIHISYKNSESAYMGTERNLTEPLCQMSALSLHPLSNTLYTFQSWGSAAHWEEQSDKLF